MFTDIRVIGTTDGDRCGRNGCLGIILLRSPRNCSCHLGMAPCSSCTEPRFYCKECGWDEAYDDPIVCASLPGSIFKHVNNHNR